MLYNLLQESSFGDIVRYASGRTVFRYPDEVEPSKFLPKLEKLERQQSPYLYALTPTQSISATLQDARTLEEATESDGKLITWLVDDPSNPQNWSLAKKNFIAFQLLFMTFSIYIGSSIFTSGIPNIAEEFGASIVVITLGLSLFVFAYGFGELIFAPLSGFPIFGSKYVYVYTLFIFVILQIPTALVTNAPGLLVLRFLAGFFASPALALPGVSFAEIYHPTKRAYLIVLWGLFASAAPVLGPLIAGYATQLHSWRWTFWILLLISGTCFIINFFLLPETFSSIILAQRAKRLRRITKDEKFKSAHELEVSQIKTSDLVRTSLLRPFYITFTEPIIFFLDLYIALVYGLLYLWFESFPLVFVGIYGFNIGETGLSYLGIAVGVWVTAAAYALYLKMFIEKKFDPFGGLHPAEIRLELLRWTAFSIPICLFWFGWSARPEVHWIVPIIGSSFFAIGIFTLFQGILSYLLDVYPMEASAVLASNGFMRSSLASGFPLFAGPMYAKLGIAWSSSLLGFVSIAMIPIPFVLYRYGSVIRRRSKFANHE